MIIEITNEQYIELSNILQSEIKHLHNVVNEFIGSCYSDNTHTQQKQIYKRKLESTIALLKMIRESA